MTDADNLPDSEPTYVDIPLPDGRWQRLKWSLKTFRLFPWVEVRYRTRRYMRLPDGTWPWAEMLRGKGGTVVGNTDRS